jgi:aminopeptidase N
VITLDALNPQVASRLARAMDRWRRYTPELQEHMKKALQQVAGQQRCRTTCAKSSAKHANSN